MSVNTPTCKDCLNETCLIKHIAFNAEAEVFLNEKICFTCKKGQPFILEGASVQGLFFIYKGKSKVIQTGIHGREQIVRFCKEGEMVGHRGFAVGDQYHISAGALEDTVVCNFSNRIMLEMLKQLPVLTYELMLFYAKELNLSETKVRKIAQMTVRERVVDTLLYLDRKFGQTDQCLNLQLTRKEIADFSGTTEEQVIRVLSVLKKEGLIRSFGKKIGIAETQKMKKEILEHNYYIAS